MLSVIPYHPASFVSFLNCSSVLGLILALVVQILNVAYLMSMVKDLNCTCIATQIRIFGRFSTYRIGFRRLTSK